MTLLEKLRLVREKLARGWTQGCYARDAAGSRTQPTWPEAVCWCLLGGCFRPVEGGGLMGELDEELRDALYEALQASSMSLACWNDQPGRTQEEVLALVDRAIMAAPAFSLAEVAT